jgi:Fe-S cluster assembly iron-binding protein IscA
MLAITETAAEAINSLITASQMPDGAGLRIASLPETETEGLELSVAPGPAEQDTVLTGGGATVFLEPIAAQALDDKVLDVERVGDAEEEQYRFAITPRSDLEG